MYDLLDWMTVNQLEFYQSVLMVYKIIKGGPCLSTWLGTVKLFMLLFQVYKA